MFRVDFVTLFPEMVAPSLVHSILGRAGASGLVAFRTANPRDFCHDRHLKVDDRPFGGEPGMLIRAEPVARAVEWLVRTPPSKEEGPPRDALWFAPGGEGWGLDASDSRSTPTLPSPGGQELARTAVVLTAPTGRPFDQAAARELAGYERVVFLCGHYEGIDHRVEEALCTHVFSIGDYVLTNGELPALVMADAVVRLVPGVLGNGGSLEADSFSDGLLAAPNYTRPVVWRGREVPAELRGGDHKAIARWRRGASLRLTREVRPDLLARARLRKGDLDFLQD